MPLAHSIDISSLEQVLQTYGPMRVEYLMSATDVPGVDSHSTRWQVIASFLNLSEGRAERLLEDEKGFILLVSAPGKPSSGAIYLYREPNRQFYMLRFGTTAGNIPGDIECQGGAREDHLDGNDFDVMLRQYGFAELIARHPSCRQERPQPRRRRFRSSPTNAKRARKPRATRPQRSSSLVLAA